MMGNREGYPYKKYLFPKKSDLTHENPSLIKRGRRQTGALAQSMAIGSD
jgi:hypothetical protein